MKWAMIVTVALAIAINLPARNKADNSAKDIAPSDGHDTTVVIETKDCACSQEQKAAVNPPLHWYRSPEWVLAIIAAVTAFVVGWQSWETRKAAQATEKNTELYINKERARLRVEMTPLVIPSTSDSGFNTVDFTVSVYGQTDAFITDSRCVAGMGPQEFINYPELFDKVMFPIHFLPSVVVANAPPKECSALLGDNEGSDNLLIEEVKAKRMFVCVRGFIKYKDVFDRERETVFRYVWRYSDVVEDYGQWERCGKPEENRET